MQRMASATRTYGGVTADERRATRREALVEAALDLFVEDGARAVSKRAVCARARLNDRYFYEHFADADALLEAIVQDQTALGMEAVNAATVDAPSNIRAQIRATADAALDFLTADPRRGRLLLGSHTSDVLQRARVDSTRAIARAMSTAIRELLGDTAASQFDTELATYALVSGAVEAIAGWLRGDFDTSREHLADLVAELLSAVADISTALPRRESRPATSSNWPP
jgi:AcrR family transcriptional regulator